MFNSSRIKVRQKTLTNKNKTKNNNEDDLYAKKLPGGVGVCHDGSCVPTSYPDLGTNVI